MPSSELTGIRHSSYLIPLPESGTWMKMLEGDQLPKVKAYALNSQIQASAVLHCIHFLVECAVTGCLVRFRLGPDRRKSRPWFWRRRLLASRHSPPHEKKKGHHRLLYSPSIPFCSALKRLGSFNPTPKKLGLMDSALGALPHLLIRATISPLLIFSLRVALSLTWTSRETLNAWHEAKKAMRKYLVDHVAGSMKQRMLGFVAPSDIWRDRPWDRFK